LNQGTARAGWPERVILFEVTTWDVNCPQHIPQLAPPSDYEERIRRLTERVAALEKIDGKLEKRIKGKPAP